MWIGWRGREHWEDLWQDQGLERTRENWWRTTVKGEEQLVWESLQLPRGYIDYCNQIVCWMYSNGIVQYLLCFTAFIYSFSVLALLQTAVLHWSHFKRLFLIFLFRRWTSINDTTQILVELSEIFNPAFFLSPLFFMISLKDPKISWLISSRMFWPLRIKKL